MFWVRFVVFFVFLIVCGTFSRFLLLFDFFVPLFVLFLLDIESFFFFLNIFSSYFFISILIKVSRAQNVSAKCVSKSNQGPQGL